MYVYMSLNLYTCVHVHVQHVTDNAQHYKDLKVVLHGYDVSFCVYQTEGPAHLYRRDSWRAAQSDTDLHLVKDVMIYFSTLTLINLLP